MVGRRWPTQFVVRSSAPSNNDCKNHAFIIHGITCVYHFINKSINQRPYKVWSCNREIRKSIVASSLFEIKIRGAEKLGYDDVSELRLVLESDGTEVEDDSYFQTAEKDTIFLLLKPDEHWLPRSVEALRSGN